MSINHARTRPDNHGLRRTPRVRRVSLAGFTLIETALATVIVGVGVLALVAAQQAFHQQNYWSTHASIAERLGNEIREMTLSLPRHDPVTTTAFWGAEPNELSFLDYDDVDDFDGTGGGLIFGADWDDVTPDNGPVNAQRQVIANMEGWSQTVTVHNVDPFDISSGTIPADFSTNMIVVEVIVNYIGPNDVTPTEMTRVSWVAPR
ncbi:MAG: hypothetical protein KJO43_05520 [Phycisphaerae bacterium]|nr:hypothetical protein [Phycisphaerae bacterium]NNF42896.1 hypothetical protein [Phycisphaerales bacterium]